MAIHGTGSPPWNWSARWSTEASRVNARPTVFYQLKLPRPIFSNAPLIAHLPEIDFRL